MSICCGNVLVTGTGGLSVVLVLNSANNEHHPLWFVQIAYLDDTWDSDLD